MGDHDMPSSWFERWQEQEPLRAYLWTIAAAVLIGSVSTGLLTETWALAIGGVAASALMVGGTALARRQVTPVLTVDQLLARQHAESYQQGVEDAVARLELVARPADVAEAETEQLQALRTPARRTLGRCRYVESGRRCTMVEHPGRFPHRLEEPRPRE
jgi:hypothetical protein